MDIKDNTYRIDDIIMYRYDWMYAKYGKPPTRIILGRKIVDILSMMYPDYYHGRFKWDYTDMFYMGIPVTVDMKNERLISMSVDEDFEV